MNVCLIITNLFTEVICVFVVCLCVCRNVCLKSLQNLSAGVVCVFVCLYECCLKLLQTFLQGSETIARLYADHENGEQYAAVDIEVCSMICGV